MWQAPLTVQADFQAAEKAWRMACVEPAPIVESGCAVECLLVASKLPMICMAWPSSRRPELSVVAATLRPFANDCFHDRRLALADPEQP